MTDLASVLSAFDNHQQPDALYAAIDAALARLPGFKLFTILVCQHEKKLTQRIYTLESAGLSGRRHQADDAQSLGRPGGRAG